MYQSGNILRLYHESTYHKPFKETFHTPSTRCGSDTSLNSPMLKLENGAYFPLPHKWIIIVCSEWPFGENHITQEPIHRFASQINLLVLYDTSPHWKSFLDILWYDTPKTPQHSETSLYSPHPQCQIKTSLVMCVDSWFYVWHTIGADFHVVCNFHVVSDFGKLIIRWKVFV